MILSRVLLNPASPEVWQWIRDASALHGALWHVFPGVPRTPDARARIALLHRLEVDGKARRIGLYVQADREPRWELWGADVFAAAPQLRPLGDLYATLRAGDPLRFRLRASPRHAEYVDRQTRGKERALRGSQACEWLARQGERLGFAIPKQGDVLDVRAVDSDAFATRKAAQRALLPSTQFDGELVVTEPAKFHEALRFGVGPRKAYGMGLLSIARSA